MAERRGGSATRRALGDYAVVGANYGQPLCPGQLLVESDLQPDPQSDISVYVMLASGFWSSTLPAPPCDATATMNIFVSDGNTWRAWDTLTYVGSFDGTQCLPTAQSQADPAATSPAAQIPLTQGFVAARFAVDATEGSALVPVRVGGSLYW
jgi:hypothetical protein